MAINPNSLKNLAPPFQAGNKANPGGKPLHAKNTITNKFLKDLAADYNEFGTDAMRMWREEHLDKYMAGIIALVPKETNININANPFAELSDEQLAALAEASRILASDTAGNGEAQDESELSPLH